LADTVLQYNESNPQLAARLLGPLVSWRQYDKQRQQLMQKALQFIMDTDNLAPDVFEIVSKSLAKGQ
jgi:aminopeptidase N